MKNIFNFTSANIFKKNNIILLFFLIVCFFSRLNSKIYLIDIISQFGFQILIVGILLFFIFLFFRKILLSLTCIFICFFLLADILLSCNHCNAFLEDKSQNHNKIRLMTFNTGLINNFKNIHEQILLESPEIIQLQEVSRITDCDRPYLRFDFTSALYVQIELGVASEKGKTRAN